MSLDWVDEFDVEPDNKEFETARMPKNTGNMVVKDKAKTKRIEKREAAKNALDNGLPRPGETFHFITDARYDYFAIIVLAVEMLGGVKSFYGSTWTMNRDNVQELLNLFDDGKIKELSMLTGLYFKRRESAVYAQLLTGLEKRKQRFNSFRNHTKIALLQSGTDHIVMEGSANFTANPRLENFIICNDKGLYNFHREWMEEMLVVDGKKTV